MYGPWLSSERCDWTRDSQMASPDLFVIAAFLGLPLVTLAHELGHARASMSFTNGPVEVYVGRTDCALRFRAGRLRMSFSPIGGGGLCRSSRRGMSREQVLVRVLAGPGVNVGLAVVAWLVGDAVTGSLRAVLFTLAAISALQILNLIPRWGVWGPLRKGVPSDGLQALCLIRRRPLPPSPTTLTAHGLKDPVGWSEAIGMVVALAVGALLAARAIPVDAVYLFAGLALQGVLDARAPRLKPAGHASLGLGGRADEGLPQLRGRDPTGCPALLLLPLLRPATACTHRRPALPRASRASRPAILGRIVLYGIVLVVVTITLVADPQRAHLRAARLQRAGTIGSTGPPNSGCPLWPFRLRLGASSSTTEARSTTPTEWRSAPKEAPQTARRVWDGKPHLLSQTHPNPTVSDGIRLIQKCAPCTSHSGPTDT